MRFDPIAGNHQRKSVRLKGYDYSAAGAYFVTICTQNRECLFGEIVVGVGSRACPENAGIGQLQSQNVHPLPNNGQPQGVAPTDPILQPPSIGPKGNTPTEMILNDAGRMITRIWHQIPDYYPGIDIDEFVVMPNHIHGIIIIGTNEIVGAGPRACPENAGIGQPPLDGQPQSQNGLPLTKNGQPQGVVPMDPTLSNVSPMISRKLSFPDIVHRFKTMTTKQYTDGVKRLGWPPFERRLWQRNYYEHIVRDEDDINRLREYIRYNVANWEKDDELTQS